MTEPSGVTANRRAGGKHSRSRSPGSPSPKFQQMEQRAAALRDRFPPGSVGHEFFSRLRESAEAVLERERIDDEQFGFE